MSQNSTVVSSIKQSNIEVLKSVIINSAIFNDRKTAFILFKQFNTLKLYIIHDNSIPSQSPQKMFSVVTLPLYLMNKVIDFKVIESDHASDMIFGCAIATNSYSPRIELLTI